MSRRSQRLTLPARPAGAPTAPAAAGKPPSEAIPTAEPGPEEAGDQVEAETARAEQGAPATLRMRLPAGFHAISAGEAEVTADGGRIAGGSGTFEFNLWVETWVDITVIRP